MDKKGMISRGFLKAVLLTILLAGTMDICAAFLNSFIRSGTKPLIVLQFIASGAIGQSAFSMGLVSGAVGLLFHFIFVTIWTLLFFLVYPKFKISFDNRLITGFLYGLFIWLVMNFLVVPLSRTPKFPLQVVSVILGLIYVILCVGLPISLIYHRYRMKHI